MEKGNVLLGCSGGIDSCVAIDLLLHLDFDVTILNFSTWIFGNNENYLEKQGSIISKMSKYFDVKCIYVNSRKEFYHDVVCSFVDTYFAGSTPNPCASCNRKIKFKILYDKALNLGFKYIATGHYANINTENGRYFIQKGVDEEKDQSYMLWQLPQEYLKKVIFPLGKYKKTDVKEISKKIGINSFIENKESEDLCFLPNKNYRDLLRTVKNTEIRRGNFIFQNKIVGQHEGYPFYTIGQRKGLGVAFGKPVFVQKINKDENEVYLCYEEDLWTDEMMVSNLNFQKYETIKNGFECNVKIRYKDNFHKCVIQWVNSKVVKVKFEEKVRAITKGQSAVFYEGNDLVFGGIIM